MKQRGSVFVMALVVVTVATTVLALTLNAQEVASRATQNRLQQSRAELMVDAGLERAKAELELITQDGLVDQTQEWFALGTSGQDRFLVGRDSFRLEIIDAGSLLNLNTATEEELQDLGLSQSQVDALLDWRESGETPRAEGAKNEYYNALPKPYSAGLRRLNSLNETLLIKDWLPSTLYQAPDASISDSNSVLSTRSISQMCTTDSYSPNVNASGQGKTNLNTAQVQQLVQAGLSTPSATALVARRNGLGGAFTTLNQAVTTPGLDSRGIGLLLDSFTISTETSLEGKINLNTAQADVLETLPGITPDIADGIISRQSTGFQTLSQIQEIAGISPEILGQIADQITISSSTFLVRVEGTAGQIHAAKEFVVRVSTGTATVAKVLDAPFSVMISQWQWEDAPTNDVVLVEETGS